jgi:hypothetical protein
MPTGQEIKTAFKKVLTTAVAVVALAGAVTLGAVAAPSGVARAQILTYCGVVNTGTWCGRNDIDHTYHGNQSDAGFVHQCERMLSSSTHTVRYPGPTCAYSPHKYCYTSRGNTGILYEAEVQQRSGGQKSVTGYGAYGTLSPNLC